jgi:hypothetical protein
VPSGDTTGLDGVQTRPRSPWTRQWAIVVTASSPFSTSLHFRTGGLTPQLFILDATALQTLVFTIRNTKSSV